MEFWQQVLATFIGAIGGFVLSMAFFYWKENHVKKSEKKSIKENLIKETEYNIKFLNDLEKTINKAIRDISNEETNIYVVFEFYKLQRFFIITAFQKGVLYKCLTIDEIRTVDTMLNFFDVNKTTDRYAYNKIEEYTNELTDIKKRSSIKALENLENQVSKYLDLFKNIKPKLKKV